MNESVTGNDTITEVVMMIVHDLFLMIAKKCVFYKDNDYDNIIQDYDDFFKGLKWSANEM